MPKLVAAAVCMLIGLALEPAEPAMAEVGCAPYCDFTHYYGPYDFTWVRPGLYAYPRCAPDGSCSPYLVSSWQRFRGRVTVRRLPRPLRPSY